MTQKQFNQKYKQYIPQGWGGLEFDIEKVTDYLDKVMQDLIEIPGFEVHQIKLKFNMARFYFDTAWKSKELEAAIRLKVEERINDLVKGYDRWDKISRAEVKPQEDWMDKQYRDEYHKTVASGMFFEWYPNLTGQWQKDKQAFVQEMESIKNRIKK